MWPFIYSISFESEFFVANIAPTVYLYVYARDSHIETPRKRYAFSRARRAPRSPSLRGERGPTVSRDHGHVACATETERKPDLREVRVSARRHMHLNTCNKMYRYHMLARENTYTAL